MLYNVQPTLPPWTAIIGFFLGTLTGSFLNMLIYRLPNQVSLIRPSHSICPNCKHQLTAIDLVPIFSWLSTGGKCRYCKKPIAVRYLLVELLVGTLFAIVWLQTMTVDIDAKVVPFALLAAASAIFVAIVFIDWEHYIIPDELNAGLLAIGLGYQAYQGHFKEGLVGALVGLGLLWGFVFLGRLAFGKDAMGDGDIKMMRGAGALLGPVLVLTSIGFGVVLGLIGGIIGLAVEARRAKAQPAENGAGEAAEEEAIEATPIPLVLLGGVIYLFCIDIVALFVPALNRKLHKLYGYDLPYHAEHSEADVPGAEVSAEGQAPEEDNWKPSATTIPFGPYLAAGSMICMLAHGPVTKAVEAYWRNATGAESRAMLERSGNNALDGRSRPTEGHFKLEQSRRI